MTLTIVLVTLLNILGVNFQNPTVDSNTQTTVIKKILTDDNGG